MREGLHRVLSLVGADTLDRNTNAEDDIVWREAEMALKEQFGESYIEPSKRGEDEMRTLAGGDVTFNINGKKGGDSAAGKIAKTVGAAIVGSGLTVAGIAYFDNSDASQVTVKAATAAVDPSHVDIRGVGKQVE